MKPLALLLVCLALPVHAAATLQLDSALFQYRYELDSAPNNQDLDANATDDWWDTGIPTVSGGYAANTAADQLYRGDFTGAIFRSVANATTADWTMEITVAKTGGTQGTNGWFGIATDPAGENLSSAIYLKDDRVSIEAGATDLDFMSGTAFGNGDYYTIRIAHDAVANSYYYWVNGTLLNASLSTPIAPGNPNMNASGSIFIGDYSSSLAGNYSIDSIRLDSTGAYAPVPEPALSMLGLLGAVALLRRRR
ncbi:hypothetical protein [Haloferula sp. BvORR071]|uniref:hypothetical protein n=1 Tax=Haloferula sp. BvORR071 TaxID=1396141 RepID=UPI002240FDAF|nr:hypothetical protein [Haloferula sp. BvORR071]